MVDFDGFLFPPTKTQPIVEAVICQFFCSMLEARVRCNMSTRIIQTKSQHEEKAVVYADDLTARSNISSIVVFGVFGYVKNLKGVTRLDTNPIKTEKNSEGFLPI